MLQKHGEPTLNRVPRVQAVAVVKPAQSDIRALLRSETQPYHDATEIAFSRHDVSASGGLRRYFLAHYRAHAAIEREMRQHLWPSNLPKPHSALPSLAQSLGAMDLPLPSELPRVEFAEPVGVAYVVAGARFGNRILKKRWRRCDDPLAKFAGAYFEDQRLDQHSRTFMAALGHYHPTDIPEVLISARVAFGIFAQAAIDVH